MRPKYIISLLINSIILREEFGHTFPSYLMNFRRAPLYAHRGWRYYIKGIEAMFQPIYPGKTNLELFGDFEGGHSGSEAYLDGVIYRFAISGGGRHCLEDNGTKKHQETVKKGYIRRLQKVLW